MSEWYTQLHSYLPSIGAATALIPLLWLTSWLLIGRHQSLGAGAKAPRQLMLLILSGAAALIVLLLIPMSDTTRGQVLSLLSVVLTGVIALSSTTFVANAMAGLMLRVVKSFRAGDFIRINGQFGRVTERGFFHTEIQTEDRDLTTLPNLHLVTNPMTVVHSSGTIISAQLSLGYDVPHTQVEELLKEAALQAQLQDAFVQVKELGDYSVIYKVAGFLPEVKQLLTAKSNLHKCILDVLHGQDIEIVSPAFMNQRRLAEGSKVIPQRVARPVTPLEQATPEALIFDKAEQAGKVEELHEAQAQLVKQLDELNAQKKAAGKQDKASLETQIDTTKDQLQALTQDIEDKQTRGPID